VRACGETETMVTQAERADEEASMLSRSARDAIGERIDALRDFDREPGRW
jgi:hypothetical protein